MNIFRMIVSILLIFLANRILPAEEINISDFDEKWVINGAGEQDALGIHLDGAGDFNGDGIDDFVLGTGEIVGSEPYDNFGYVLMGTSDFPSIINLESPPSGTVVIQHPRFSELPVAGLGNFNGDKYADVAFADPKASIEGVNLAGRVFVMFGGDNLPAQILDFDDPQTPGVMINGYRSGGSLGVSMAAAGDVNGDGLGDILLGSFTGSISEAFLVFGATDLPDSLSIENLGENGIRSIGQIGLSGGLSGAGDVNRDGIDDFMIGAGSLSDQRLGHVFLIYGATDLPQEIDTANLGSLGIDIYGTNTGEGFGRNMSSAGDVNGDGYDDVIFSSLLADIDGIEDAGQVFLLFGSSDLPEKIQNTNMGIHGFTINGVLKDKELGRGLASVGDINEDGFADFSLCSPFANEANIIYGSKDMKKNDVVQIDQIDRIRFYGIVPDPRALGTNASSLGDINNDGINDIAFGDLGRTTNDHFSAGSVFIIKGQQGRFQSLPQKSDLNKDGAVNHKDLFLFQEQWQVEKQP